MADLGTFGESEPRDGLGRRSAPRARRRWVGRLTAGATFALLTGCAALGSPTSEAVELEPKERIDSGSPAPKVSPSAAQTACDRALRDLDVAMTSADASAAGWAAYYDLSLAIDEETIASGTSPESDYAQLDEYYEAASAAEQDLFDAEDAFLDGMTSCDVDDVPAECAVALDLYNPLSDAYFAVVTASRNLYGPFDTISEAYETMDIGLLETGVEAMRPALAEFHAAVDAWSPHYAEYRSASDACDAAQF